MGNVIKLDDYRKDKDIIEVNEMDELLDMVKEFLRLSYRVNRRKE